MRKLMLTLLSAAVVGFGTANARTRPAAPAVLKVDRVVVLMRHGVRPPTKSPPMPAGTADADWPSWDVAPGYLTARGASAIGLIGDYDRARWIAASVLPRSGCPRVGGVRIVADSDQRTIATAAAYAAHLAPGCPVTIEHRPQDEPDPIFSPIDEGRAPLDPALANAAVQAALPAGIAAEDRRQHALLTRLDTIVCAKPAATCGVARTPTTITPATAAKRPKLAGALDRASTAAQILLLEYADAKPLAQVGWGRASAADIARLSAFHALEFRILARPHYLAAKNLTLIAPIIAAALQEDDAKAASITMISGHDTNVASLGGLLGLHWQVPGLAADDPSPGGAIVLERLTDRSGAHFVRAVYRSQTIEQIRTLTSLDAARPYEAVIPIAGCRSSAGVGVCTLAQFAAKLAAR